MTVNEYRQQVYRVMVTVLAIPDANPRIVAEKCNLSLPDLWTTLEFTDTEGLLSGLRIQHGGQGKAPLLVIYDRAQRTLKGMEFMEHFEKEGIPHISGDERPTLFISYNRETGSGFADTLEKRIASCASVKLDTNMAPWESFTEFMKTIRKQDFAVLVITDKYLRSEACMFEVSEVMKDENWRDKVMFAVLEDAVYTTGATEYLRYWQDQREKANLDAKSIEPMNMESITAKIKKITGIELCFNTFFAAVCDSNNPKPYEVIDAILDRIRYTTNQDFAAGLDNTTYASERERAIRQALGEK